MIGVIFRIVLICFHFSEMEKKKAEVRARLEAQSASKKKKGFMTPERKKKLRVHKYFSYLLFRFSYS